MSGEQFTKLHALPSRDTAMLAWVRRTTRASRAHASAQIRQRQFHCGTPPPAADPRITIFTAKVVPRPWAQPQRGQRSDLGWEIVVDLEADTDLSYLRFAPAHSNPPSQGYRYPSPRKTGAQLDLLEPCA